MANGNDNLNVGKLVGLGLGGLVGLILLLGSFKTISPGQRGIKVTMGKAGETVLDEGLHFKLPLISSIKTISVQIQKSEAQSEAATKDLQRVGAVLALNWSIDPSKVVELYRTIGTETDIFERVIKPAVSEVLKSSTAKMTAEEVLTRRMELKNNIDESLKTRLATYNVIVKDVSLVDLDFTKEFNHAVEKKQIAEQEAQQANYNAVKATNDAKAAVNTAKGEADSTLIRAKAQADAQKLLQQTVSPEILQLKAIEKWDGSVPTVMGSGGNMLFNIPVKGKAAKAAQGENND